MCLQAATRLGVQACSAPQISSFDLSLLNDWTTPNQFFFSREPFPAPAIPGDSRPLAFGGAVETPLELSLDALVAEPTVDLAVTLGWAKNPVYLVVQVSSERVDSCVSPEKMDLSAALHWRRRCIATRCWRTK